MKHFSSRSAQPKGLIPAASTPTNHPTVNNFYISDSGCDGGFGNAMDQVSGVKFRYTGTTPQISRYENMSAQSRSRQHNMMGAGSAYNDIWS